MTVVTSSRQLSAAYSPAGRACRCKSPAVFVVRDRTWNKWGTTLLRNSYRCRPCLPRALWKRAVDVSRLDPADVPGQRRPPRLYGRKAERVAELLAAGLTPTQAAFAVGCHPGTAFRVRKAQAGVTHAV